MLCYQLFYLNSLSIPECENEDITMNHLTVEEHPWDSATEEYSECETSMSDYLGQIIHPATVAWWPLFVSAIILYSLAYDSVDVMDDGNLVCIISPDSEKHIADKHGQKTISRAYNLGQMMGDIPVEVPEDYSSHNPERGLDYAPPFIFQTTQNK